MRKINSKKGQLQISDAPGVVMIVGLVFLTMATVALISQKMGESMLVDTSASVTNETGFLNSTGYTLAQASRLNADTFVITEVLNATDETSFLTGNVTVSATGLITNSSATTWDSILISYTYIYNPETVAYNTTGDLQTEISNNTSIAGIVLTISLVGIVLSILIGVFMGIQRRTRI
jgi:hypothetical protein